MAAEVRSKSRFSWLKPPKPSPDGKMELIDHLRELRYRVMAAVVAIIGGMIVCWFFVKSLIWVIMWPYESARQAVIAAVPDAKLQVVNMGALAPFVLAFQVSMVGGVIISCPLWLYQVWAFIAPALLKKEKRKAILFLGSAIPLFLMGATMSYFILPAALKIMLQFTPPGMGIVNMMELSTFLGFEMRMMLVFGLAFLLPVILVTLNKFHIVKGYQLGKVRSYAIFGIFLFSAIATPSTDPLTMTLLAIPMVLLYEVAEIMCRLNDKRSGIIKKNNIESNINLDA